MLEWSTKRKQKECQRRPATWSLQLEIFLSYLKLLQSKSPLRTAWLFKFAACRRSLRGPKAVYRGNPVGNGTFLFSPLRIEVLLFVQPLSRISIRPLSETNQHPS